MKWFGEEIDVEACADYAEETLFVLTSAAHSSSSAVRVHKPSKQHK